jgi:hypothetical protein
VSAKISRIDLAPTGLLPATAALALTPDLLGTLLLIGP